MRGLPVAFHRVRGERIACILGVLAGLSVLRHSPNQGRERTSGLFYFIFNCLDNVSHLISEMGPLWK